MLFCQITSCHKSFYVGTNIELCFHRMSAWHQTDTYIGIIFVCDDSLCQDVCLQLSSWEPPVHHCHPLMCSLVRRVSDHDFFACREINTFMISVTCLFLLFSLIGVTAIIFHNT